MFKINFKSHRYLFGVLFALFAYCISSCKDDNDVTITPFDPTKPVTITDFIPKSGTVGQKLIIHGDNFGNDTSLVKVTIGGKPAPVINVKGDGIYCFVPEGAFSGEIKVTVGKGEKYKEAVAKTAFEYQREMVVGTLCGYMNRNDDQGWREGSFSSCCGFKQEMFFCWDPLYPNRLYVSYDNWDRPGIQCLDFNTQTVRTVLSESKFNGCRQRSIAFTNDGKYMLVATDNNDRGTDSPAVWIVTRAADGTFNNNCEVNNLANYRQCNGAVVHPINGEVYFNSYEQGQVFRLDLNDYFNTLKKIEEAKKKRAEEIAQGVPEEQLTAVPQWEPAVVKNPAFKQLFTIQDREWEFKMVIHPSGKYAYINVINRSYLLRMNYDEAKKEFTAPYIIAGAITTGTDAAANYKEGAGTDARFWQPYQGIFVKNKEYEAEGRSELYDFYITDKMNHAVRKMTPEGIVSTFAGRGSRTEAADGNRYGVDNGPLRTVARFNRPTGIAYDEASNTFYIGDLNNRLIRTISLEKDDESEDTSGE